MKIVFLYPFSNMAISTQNNKKKTILYWQTGWVDRYETTDLMSKVTLDVKLINTNKSGKHAKNVASGDLSSQVLLSSVSVLSDKISQSRYKWEHFLSFLCRSDLRVCV